MDTGWKSPRKVPQAAEHLRLVAHADLAQFYAHFEDAGQILDQFAEVHAAIGGKVKDDL